MDLNAAIEKNRISLLRIVSTWLVFSFAFACSNQRVLPRRISLWASEFLCKVELATEYLIIATSNLNGAPNRLVAGPSDRLCMDHSGARLTVHAVRARLKIVRNKLRNLQLFAKRRVQRMRSRSNAAIWPGMGRQLLADLSVAYPKMARALERRTKSGNARPP